MAERTCLLHIEQVCINLLELPLSELLLFQRQQGALPALCGNELPCKGQLLCYEVFHLLAAHTACEAPWQAY